MTTLFSKRSLNSIIKRAQFHVKSKLGTHEAYISSCRPSVAFNRQETRESQAGSSLSYAFHLANHDFRHFQVEREKGEDGKGNPLFFLVWRLNRKTAFSGPGRSSWAPPWLLTAFPWAATGTAFSRCPLPFRSGLFQQVTPDNTLFWGSHCAFRQF